MTKQILVEDPGSSPGLRILFFLFRGGGVVIMVKTWGSGIIWHGSMAGGFAGK